MNGTYTIKIDYIGNGVGATPMSLIGWPAHCHGPGSHTAGPAPDVGLPK